MWTSRESKYDVYKYIFLCALAIGSAVTAVNTKQDKTRRAQGGREKANDEGGRGEQR